ncbi:MAG: primosomal protein N' [Microcella sp.]|uniref:primosomal protein N' family DNA-binding protein n=1 Tax=Microcella sp. TaxID=1913979 RepID=UPI003316195F
MDGTPSFARVVLDSPLPQLDRLFDYRIPEALSASAQPGVRVIVPLRTAGRRARGYIVELADRVDFEGPVNDLEDVVSEVPVLDPAVWRLLRRAADRAAGTASDILRLAVPPRMVRVEKAWLARPDGHPRLPSAPVITGYDAVECSSLLRSAEPGQHGSRIALRARPHPVALVDGTWVPAFAQTLAELAAAVIAGGRSAIVSVPDYRDVAHVERAARTLLDEGLIARVDAGQSNPDRYRGFLRTLEGRPVLVLGTRTAVTAPAYELGLIAVWDDGDPLHVEQHAPGVHTRDLALLRQEGEQCALVFAGHAPSADIQRLLELRWLSALSPRPDARRRLTPTAHQVQAEPAADRARIPSSAWQTASRALESGPVLVQVARPGYAPRLACSDCGETARCARCQGPLAQEAQGATPSCRWCGALAVGWRCAACDGVRWRTVGRGTARTADELGRAFPGARVIVADGSNLVQSIPRGRTLVVATRGAEPLVAGGYSAVLLLDGEQMLARESLRVVEDCVRWWLNAAALAAPDAPVMLAGVGGAVATALALGRPEQIVASELADRRSLRFPPAVRVAAVLGEPDSVAQAVRSVSDVPGVDVLGPVELDDDRVRAIIRFDYAQGALVAERLKAEIIRSSTQRPKPLPGRPPRRRTPLLRVRFDDVEPFDDPGGNRARATGVGASGRIEG